MTGEFGFFAYFALAGVVLSSLALFFTKKPEAACITLIMASILFLPERVAFKLPKVPALDRDTLPYLCFLVALAFRRPGWIKSARVGRGLDALLIASMAAAVVTALTNRDGFSVGSGPRTQLPGLDLNDGIALAATDLARAGIPFILGRILIRDARQAKRLLVAFAIGGLLYSLPMFVELRLSPQLHKWIYGYAPRENDFAQAMRYGGYRPIVFMSHPLAVAIFICNSALAAFVLARSKARLLGLPWKPFAYYLVVVLAATKCFASLVYTIAIAPFIVFTRPRTQLRVAAAITALVVTYPLLRSTDLFPTKTVLSGATLIAGADRQGSLAFRFDNEDQLLDKARQRLLFGWGGYGRNAIYNQYGHNVSVLDGEWIISLSTRGATGALCSFLLLLAPVWLALRSLRKVDDPRDKALLAGTALMVALSALDLLPNSLFSNYAFFLAGGLAGMARAFAASAASSNDSASVYELGPPPRVSAVD